MKLLRLFIILLAGACYAADAPTTAPKTVIEAGLKALMSREKNKDAFVIFTDSQSKAYVQFTYENKELWIDIPLIEKSKKETDGIKKVFSSIGITNPEITTARDPETKKPFILRSYQASFGNNEAKAAEFSMRLFKEAFNINSLFLTVETE